MEFLRSEILGDRVKHAFTLRDGGVSKGSFASLNLGFDTGDDAENVRKNYQIFCNEFGLNMDDLVLAHQEHGDEVMVFDKDFEANFGLENIFSGVDGFITNKPGLALIVRFADCQGILMFDPVNKVIAAIHSGWRGNAKNIVGKTIEKMKNEFGVNPSNLLVAVSPSLGPCCAEFSKPHEELPEFMHRYIKTAANVRSQADSSQSDGLQPGLHVDLWQCTFDQLIEVGIKPENIDMARRCTVCENDKFFSYRAGKGQTGHMSGMIQL